MTPDLTGLVPHSTKWMLLSNTPVGELNRPDDIQLLDLESMELTPGNPDKTVNVIGGLSPDARTYFFSNGDGAAVSARIIHLEPNGFVPARKLKDYALVAGAYRVLSWSFDSRFAMVSRGAGDSSVEVVDMWLEKRVHTEAFSSIVAELAPSGYSFFYDAALQDGYEPRYASITRTGISPLQKLPADADNMRFDPSGKYLFYTLSGPTANKRVFVRSLADGATKELAVATGEEQTSGYDLLGVQEDSVLVSVRATAATAAFTRRVFFDADEESQKVAEGDIVRHSDDNNLVLGRNFTEKTLDLVRVEPFVSQRLPQTYVGGSSESWAGIVGDHAFYVATDGLHVSSLSPTGELRDAVLSSADPTLRACFSRFAYEPKDRLAYLAGDGEALVFVDLRQEPPVVVDSFEPGAGAKVACPTWGDADSALGFVVTAADGTSSAYFSTWTGAAPSKPTLASTTARRVYALMHR